MKLLKKPYDIVKGKVADLPKLSLCYPKIKIEEESHRPYFIIGFILNSHGEATRKLYADDLKLQLEYYKKQFSNDDWSLIQYNLGGLESLQLGGTYQIIGLDFENMKINVRNRSTAVQEAWDVATTITNKKYLNLDKQSILEFGIFYQKIKTSNLMQKKIKQELEKEIKKTLYLESLDELQNNINKFNHLKIVK